MRPQDPPLLLCVLIGLCFTTAKDSTPPTPRVQLSFRELKASNTAHFLHFLLNTTDYRILLKDEDHDRMYVGSKDYILSLDLQDINREPLIIHWPAKQQRIDECVLSGKDMNGECGNFIRLIQPWNRTHLYACGTGAYNPVCTYINRGRKAQDYIFYLDPDRVESGKGKCAYDPKLDSVSALINEELYSGVYIDFMGTDAAIFRAMGKQAAMRTDQYNSRWLNDPAFVHVQLIPDSLERNDDKLYFFFREKSTDSPHSPTVFSRIGRVCLNDDGGHCCLVNKWSTFLKARLICSVPGADGIETHFDELRKYLGGGRAQSPGACDVSTSIVITEDVFIQQTQDNKNPVIYAVFSASGSVFKGSAVCVYSMADIRMVFNGPFAHKEGPNYQWMPYTGKIPYPRPGTCPGGTFTPSMKSTKDYPDEVINFMRTHPVMYNPVYPIHRQPLLVRTNVNYKFTTIAVDQVDASDGRYEVLFLGTDQGTVQKVIVLPKDDLETEELMLEEVEVFKVPAPIKSMKISSKRQQLYVSSLSGVTHLALHRCDVYGEACADCCLARDPYCAWDGKTCSRYSASSKRRSRRQDVRHGNPIRQCRGYNSNANKIGMEAAQYGVEGSSAFLECQARSPQASIKWILQKDNSERKKELRSEGRLLKTEQGLLIRSLQLSDSGVYHCTATENNFKHTVMRVRLQVLSAEAVTAALLHPEAPAAQSSHPAGPPGAYDELVQLLSQPEMGLINQYCQGYWRPNAHSDAKDLQDQKRARNRRNHPPTAQT
ncbi:semaphorin-3F-like isoform X4 [Engystomops pustulosus]|uniref:semaphorin-3F-like isoform X4 n=1 Tax=Engystomops pustulosus TaxID=76066 RepID=UPI003AFB4AB6